MLDTQRILYSDNGTITDKSLVWCDYMADTDLAVLTKDEDAIYIGSLVPFNSIYFDVSVANDVAASLSVKIWNNRTWESAVDLIDATSTSGKTLAKSGVLKWTTQELKGWTSENYSYDITGLETTEIYNLYWIKITSTATLKLTTAINYIGHRFASSSDLYSLYPDLNNSVQMAAYKTGSTDWNEQMLNASEFIVRDLIGRGIIKSGFQLFDYTRFKNACIHKAAEIIYNAYGQAYTDIRNDCRKAYFDDINNGRYSVDITQDGVLESKERSSTVNYFSR